MIFMVLLDLLFTQLDGIVENMNHTCKSYKIC